MPSGHIHPTLHALPTREEERAEIHLLAQGLGLVTADNSELYRKAMSVFFNGKRHSSDLTDVEHTQLLVLFRAWAKCKAIIADRASESSPTMELTAVGTIH